MKLDMSLLKLLNVSLLFGVTNLFISEISGDDTDLIIKDDLITRANVMPIHYDVKLTLDPKSQRRGQNIFFEGECHIKVLIPFPTNYITLQIQESYVKVYRAAMFSMVTYSTVESENHVEHFIYVDGNNQFEVHFTTKLHGNFRLTLYFNGLKSDEDVFKLLYKTGTEYKMLLVATHLRPTRTRTLFPCWDYLKTKTTFEITLYLDDNYTALTNMPIRPPYKNATYVYDPEREMNMFTFHKTSGMSTYDIAIVIFDRYLFSHNIMWYRYNMLEHTKFAQIIANNVTQHLNTKLENFQELTNVSHIVIPGFPHNAMRKSGLNIFREEAILYDITMDPFATKIEVARLVTRIIVHERLNNLVSPAWWSYLWLNEGIAMLLGQDTVHKIFPDLRILDLFIVQFHQESLRLDTNLIGPIMQTVTSGTNINTLFSFSYYIKAPVILYMLQRLLSNEVFFKGIKAYFTYKTASLDDFCTAMQIALNESTLRNKFNIKEVMNAWSKKINYSVVNVKEIKNPLYIRIQIDNINIEDDIYLPITITTQSNLNFTFTMDRRQHANWLERKNGLFGPPILIGYNNFQKDDWIIINLQQTGYYRIKYYKKNWRRLARYLKSEDYTQIHVLNRAQIMDDAFHFWMAGDINLSIFLDFIQYLSRETDYVVWYPTIKYLEYISSYFPYEGSNFIKEKFRASLNDLFQNIRHEEDNDNIVSCLKQEVSKWACILGSFTCRRMATSNLQRIYFTPINKNNYRRILPWWKDWMNCGGLMQTDFIIWRKTFDIFLDATDDEMLKFLACSEEPDTIVKYIQLITNDKEIQYRIENKRIKVPINIFHSIIAKHAKTTLVLEYMLEHFNHIIPREISPMIAITDIINHVYSIQHLNKIREFLITDKFLNDSLVTHKMNIRSNEIEEQKERFRHIYKEQMEDEIIDPSDQ